MKHQWVVYAVVTALSLGVGVAIAGFPSSEPLEPTIIVAEPEPEPEAEPSPSSTSVELTTTVPPETTLPTTTVPVPTTTVAAETTTTAEPAPVAPDRATVPVVVANGANIGGLASRTAQLLEALGYVDVVATDGTEVFATSVVYYSDPDETAAAQLAADLSLDPDSIAPIADAPDIRGTLPEVGLLVYLGSDTAGT